MMIVMPVLLYLSSKFVKCCLKIKDRGQHFANRGDQIFNDDCYASFVVPQNQTILQVNKYTITRKL